MGLCGLGSGVARRGAIVGGVMIGMVMIIGLIVMIVLIEGGKRVGLIMRGRRVVPVMMIHSPSLTDFG